MYISIVHMGWIKWEREKKRTHQNTPWNFSSEHYVCYITLGQRFEPQGRCFTNFHYYYYYWSQRLLPLGPVHQWNCPRWGWAGPRLYYQQTHDLLLLVGWCTLGAFPGDAVLGSPRTATAVWSCWDGSEESSLGAVRTISERGSHCIRKYIYIYQFKVERKIKQMLPKPGVKIFVCICPRR